MSDKKTSNVLNFIKKNLYYFIIGLSVAIIAIVVAVVIASSSNGVIEGEKPKTSESSSEIETVSQSEKEVETQKSSEKDSETESQTESQSEKPVDSNVVFILPVQNSSVTKDYTSSTVVFNKTLGVYTGHMGIDFSAEAGTEVVCCYDGIIESVTTSYLKGTTVTVDHGNGLKSVYNSIEADESLLEGKNVTKGDVLGTVSDNNRQEYKDGTHLHFEVYENGVTVNPEKYLMMQQK